MLDNIPSSLESRIREAPTDLFEHRYLIAAICVCEEYLGRALWGEQDPFLELGIESKSSNSIEHLAKIILVANTLFSLRSCPGFSEMTRRMRGRSLRSTFYELWSAHYMLESGYEIFAKRETFQKGRDFDFSAVREGKTVNVEVTALTAAAFSEATLMNALNKKRKQLPSDQPSIIFCAYPESWFGIERDPADFLSDVTNRFFRGSKRVNAIVYVTEVHISAKDMEYGGLTLRPTIATHFAPRIAVDLTGLYDMHNQDEPAEILQMLSGTANDIRSAEQKVGKSEFQSWVDSIYPRQAIREP